MMTQTILRPMYTKYMRQPLRDESQHTGSPIRKGPDAYMVLNASALGELYVIDPTKNEKKPRLIPLARYAVGQISEAQMNAGASSIWNAMR